MKPDEAVFRSKRRKGSAKNRLAKADRIAFPAMPPRPYT
jgi:hypothetical protein